MARIIDANEFLSRLSRDISKGHYGEFMDGSEVAFTMREIESLVSELSTLTPPNEPLTWNEFAEMEGQPVYIVEVGEWRYWALVTRVGKDSADFVTVHDPDNYGDKELYGESWVAYRCPPEGEEETR